jgi:hypothetical protein
MATETEVKPLTAEDVVKIVEETLDKREGKGKSKHDEPKPALDLDALAQKVGECVEGALDRHAAKQAEARAKVEKEKAEAEKKAAEEKRKRSPFDF